MAFTYANIIWHHDTQYVHRYGIVNIGGDRWVVVEDDNSTPQLALKKLTTVSGRDTAIGFIKLLMEK